MFCSSDKLFPALGFGARMPDGSVSHEFALVSSPGSCVVADLRSRGDFSV